MKSPLVYPQYQTGGAEAPVSQAGCPQSPADFLHSSGLNHNRPRRVTACRRTERGLHLLCDTVGARVLWSHTHETGLFLTQDCDPAVNRLHVRIDCWGSHIFRVRYSLEEQPPDPFSGLPGEAKMLVGAPQDCPLEVAEQDGVIRLDTGSAVLEIETDNFRLSLYRRENGHKRLVCRQRRPDTGTADVLSTSLCRCGETFALFESLTLEHDEEIYGLGERFDSVGRKGREVDFWNKDAIGTTSPRTYMNIPFFLSTRGYGLFLNSSARTDWQIGTRDAAALGFGVLDSQMEYFLLAGETPADILRQYCTLTGFAKLPPLWSFGLWMSRNSYTSWEKAEEAGEGMRARGIPCDVLHLDTAWFREDWNCDLRFSPERFPHPEQHLNSLKEQGFRVSLWQYNFIPPKENNPNYREAAEKGYLAADEEGNPYRLPETYRGSWVDDAVIDFSNPEARRWYGNQIGALIRMGAAAVKTDFGEGIPEQAHYRCIEGRYFHNLYSLVYNYTIWDAAQKAGGEGIVWARSGTAGSQRFPLHWGGDSQCTFQAMAGTLRGMLSAGLSGIPFFSHDIGGFIGTPTPELYVRWAQLGLFSSHSRCHGAGNDNCREPWAFGPEAEEIFREYARLRYSLMPYIIGEAEKCTRTGLPMVRSLYLAYPEDRNVRSIDDQYLFGDSLLVAPVLQPLSERQTRDIYLPAGLWIDYWTKARISSAGQWITRYVDLRTMPLYVKAGTVLHYMEVPAHLGDRLGPIVRQERY